MGSHPYGVRPLGNLLSHSRLHCIRARKNGLGLFSKLPDALVIRILDTIVAWSDPKEAARSLCHFSAASTYALAFGADEDLWRTLTFRIFSVQNIARAPFTVSWRRTFLILVSDGIHKPTDIPLTPNKFVYSDVLFHKWRCLTTAIQPHWLASCNIERISYRDVTIAQFQDSFEKPNIPVIVTNCVTDWPSFEAWSTASLVNRFGDVDFHAGGFSFPLKHYFTYSQAIDGYDDQPLYIFDKEFASKAPLMAEEYEVPKFFAEDLFRVLGPQRPDYRWLIIGPTRSGSSFHKDPNSTSAWNAVIRGRKKWVMFPPDVTPPGIYPSGDGGDVTAPLSVSEWFLNFYDSDLLRTMGARECIVEEGELIFVPMGWWHCVLNLETSIAITQNYVGSCNFASVVKWIRSRPNQVSGCRSPAQAGFLIENFAELVRQQHPQLGSTCETVQSATKNESALPRTGTYPFEKKRKQSLWEALQTKTSAGRRIEDSSAESGNTPSSSLKRARFAFGF